MIGNIYIIGAPRSGKSTLARALCRKYPCLNQISFEAIRNGFMKAQPELDMGNRDSKARREILPSFVLEFLNWNLDFTTRSAIMEGSFMQMRDLMQYVRQDDLVMCLGFGGRSLDEVANEVLQNQNREEYSAGWSIEKFKKHFYDLESNDLDNMGFCMEHNLPYYDVYGQRGMVHNKAMDLVNHWIGN